MDIFSPIPVRARGITASLVNTEIRVYEKDMFTGIFHANGGSQLVFLFAQGRLLSVYRLEGGRGWRLVPKSEWDDAIAGAAGELRVTGLTGDGLRLLRLFLESDFSDSQTEPALPASELTAYVKHARGHRAGLVSLSHSGTTALALFPAGTENPAEAVLLDDQQVQTGSVALNQIRAWGSRSCRAQLSACEPRSAAWREYFLRVSFAQFVQFVLSRYGELAGNFLVTDLGEQVNDEMQGLGVALALYGNKLSNRQFFENAERASVTYTAIFEMMLGQMRAVVGEKVVLSLRREAVMQLELDDRAFVQEYVVSRLKQE
jgi:hypothetical protein